MKTKAYLHLNSWAGRQKINVLVVGETPKKFRIELLEDAKLPRRFCKAGSTTLVPKYAISQPPNNPKQGELKSGAIVEVQKQTN